MVSPFKRVVYKVKSNKKTYFLKYESREAINYGFPYEP